MRRVITIFFIFAGFCSENYGQQTLDECQRMARENYPLVSQLELIENSRELNLSNAARSWLPQFSITGMASITEGIPDIALPGTATGNGNHQFAGIAGLSQTIWDGGNSKAQRRMADAAADTERESVEVELYQLRERVNQLYFGVLLIDEQLRQTNILMETLRSGFRRAEASVGSGIAYPSDMDKIAVEILNTEQTLINLQACRRAYCRMLGLMTGQDITSQTTFEKPATVQHTAAMPVDRPELRLFESRRQLNDARNLAVTSSYMPKIGLRGYAVGMTPGIHIGGNKLDYLMVAGISLSWSSSGLYTKNNERNKIKISNRMIDALQQTFLMNTHLELSRQDGEIERCRQLIRKDDEIVRLRERIKKASETRYGNGACTMTDLLNDINAEHLARQTKVHHETEFLMYLYQQQTTSGNNGRKVK
ncbi:MAG: TolC family protein [Dysgonamonadaceae bacterium]|jgi:outer membrane protein TolC|nr:TolC family protein [Dysgonamonadaceae bacterium]